MALSNDPKTSHPSPLRNFNKSVQGSKIEDFDKGRKEAGKYLGIDFGKAKIGLAIADGETKIAFALKTLDNNKDFLSELVKIIQENEINKLVIGIPAYVNKEEIEYESERLGKLIKKIIDIKIEYQNEMFTTKMAQDNLIEKGAKNIKSQDDQEAARIILQSWLDKS
jgi:putative holliday junction resolvase